MLYTLIIFAGLFNYTFAAPLSSCLTQADCLDASITELDELDDDGNVQYEICLIFDATLDECVKDEKDSISHACVAGPDGIVSSEDGEKIEGLDTGVDDALCDTVPCGTYTTFGLKDGSSCELDGELLYANLSIPNYNEYLVCYSGMSCNSNGKNSKACKWAIVAPDCEDGTTTNAPDTTAADQDTTPADDATTSVPDTTQPDEPCVCQYPTEGAVLEDDCLGRCIYDGGCRWMGGDNLCIRNNPAASAAMYTRQRNVNDLVTVDDDDTDNTDTNGDGDNVSETSQSKAGVINLSIVSISSLSILYLLQ